VGSDVRALAHAMNFGALAAERERDHLSEFFVTSPAYDRLQSGGKIIVLGNRGAGKTALLSMLADDATHDGHVVVELAPEDFAYELLGESLATESSGSWSKQGAYAAAWKHLLYVLAMKEVLKTKPGLKTGAAKRVYSYLRDHHANVDRNPIGALISYLKRLDGVKLGKMEASLKARELQRLYRLEEIDPYLDDLNDLCQQRKALLLIDELDRGWDASEDAVAFVAGLFQAGTSIAIRTPNIRVVMSLRRELYDNIPSLYDDAQKVRDTIEVIEWDAARLFDLICRRIRYSQDSSGDQDATNPWLEVMPESVASRPSFDWLLGLTLNRPRELIQLCTQIRDEASRVRDALPFDEASVLRAASLYATERFNDLVAEYRYQYPGLGSVLETFRGLSKVISRDVLELHCLRLSLGELKVSPGAVWVAEKDPDQIIDILWKVGFVRCEVEQGAAAEDRGFYAWYELPTVNFRNVQRFQLHDMFATYLGSR
jgi:hypothetical protein